MTTRLFSAFAAAAAAFLLAGCLHESAPSGPSRSNNTWLFGVWEITSPEGEKKRAVVSPVSGDRFTVVVEEKSKDGKVLRSGRFGAWISKVGQASLLVVEVPRDGGGPGYFLLGYQLLDPLRVRVREVALPEEAAQERPFGLRKLIRRAFKGGTLFGGKDEVWRKTGEIFWDPRGNPAADTFAPPRNPPPALEKIDLAARRAGAGDSAD